MKILTQIHNIIERLHSKSYRSIFYFFLCNFLYWVGVVQK